MINGTVVYEPSDETLLFTELNQVVNSCFRNNTQVDQNEIMKFTSHEFFFICLVPNLEVMLNL